MAKKRTNEKQAYVKNIIEKKKKNLKQNGENNISKDGTLCIRKTIRDMKFLQRKMFRSAFRRSMRKMFVVYD